jgi:F0F1-type ATP synthase assembly protein I
VDPRSLSTSAALWRLSTAGITLAVCILLGLGLGLLLRRTLGLGDMAVIGGIVLGVVAGFYQMIRDISALKGRKPGGTGP